MRNLADVDHRQREVSGVPQHLDGLVVADGLEGTVVDGNDDVAGSEAAA